MIRISEDGKTFVEIESWEDLITRPGYRDKIDPSKVQIKQILGLYKLPDKHSCGIKNCGTPHNRGYLVSTTDGYETNIGNRCGAKIFGVDFTEARKAYTKASNAQRYRETLSESINQFPKIRLQVKTLREGEQGADYCVNKMQQLMNRVFPEEISRKLVNR